MPTLKKDDVKTAGMYRNASNEKHADFKKRHSVSLCLTCDQAFFFREGAKIN